MVKRNNKYEITARMCGLQKSYERLKFADNALMAMFWFVAFSLKYPMICITRTDNVPICKDCKNYMGCIGNVDILAVSEIENDENGVVIHEK